jgi:hypothetical protein
LFSGVNDTGDKFFGGVSDTGDQKVLPILACLHLKMKNNQLQSLGVKCTSSTKLLTKYFQKNSQNFSLFSLVSLTPLINIHSPCKGGGTEPGVSEPEACYLLFWIADVGSGNRVEVLNLEYLNLKTATFVQDS